MEEVSAAAVEEKLFRTVVAVWETLRWPCILVYAAFPLCPPSMPLVRVRAIVCVRLHKPCANHKNIVFNNNVACEELLQYFMCCVYHSWHLFSTPIFGDRSICFAHTRTFLSVCCFVRSQSFHRCSTLCESGSASLSPRRDDYSLFITRLYLNASCDRIRVLIRPTEWGISLGSSAKLAITI